MGYRDDNISNEQLINDHVAPTLYPHLWSHEGRLWTNRGGTWRPFTSKEDDHTWARSLLADIAYQLPGDNYFYRGRARLYRQHYAVLSDYKIWCWTQTPPPGFTAAAC